LLFDFHHFLKISNFPGNFFEKSGEKIFEEKNQKICFLFFSKNWYEYQKTWSPFRDVKIQF